MLNKPPYALPSKFTIRDVGGPLRKVIESMQPSWSGNSVSFLITSTVDYVRDTMYGWTTSSLPYSSRLYQLDLFSAEHETVMPNHARGTIPDGKALFIFRAKERYDPVQKYCDVLIHLNSFCINPDDGQELVVARDAILEGDERAGIALAKQLLPSTYGIFLAIIKYERKLLNRTVNSQD